MIYMAYTPQDRYEISSPKAFIIWVDITVEKC